MECLALFDQDRPNKQGMVRESMTVLTANSVVLGDVMIHRGIIFQGDSLSLLFFCHLLNTIIVKVSLRKVWYILKPLAVYA